MLWAPAGGRPAAAQPQHGPVELIPWASRPRQPTLSRRQLHVRWPFCRLWDPSTADGVSCPAQPAEPTCGSDRWQAPAATGSTWFVCTPSRLPAARAAPERAAPTLWRAATHPCTFCCNPPPSPEQAWGGLCLAHAQHPTRPRCASHAHTYPALPPRACLLCRGLRAQSRPGGMPAPPGWQLGHMTAPASPVLALPAHQNNVAALLPRMRLFAGARCLRVGRLHVPVALLTFARPTAAATVLCTSASPLFVRTYTLSALLGHARGCAVSRAACRGCWPPETGRRRPVSGCGVCN